MWIIIPISSPRRLQLPRALVFCQGGAASTHCESPASHDQRLPGPTLGSSSSVSPDHESGQLILELHYERAGNHIADIRGRKEREPSGWGQRSFSKRRTTRTRMSLCLSTPLLISKHNKKGNGRGRAKDSRGGLLGRNSWPSSVSQRTRLGGCGTLTSAKAVSN